MKFKTGKISIVDFEFCVIDVPDGSYPYLAKAPLSIDAELGQSSTSAKDLPPQQAGNFLMWVWVSEWNGFIRIAAREIKLGWL